MCTFTLKLTKALENNTVCLPNVPLLYHTKQKALGN